jgi:hypothetical protein
MTDEVTSHDDEVSPALLLRGAIRGFLDVLALVLGAAIVFGIGWQGGMRLGSGLVPCFAVGGCVGLACAMRLPDLLANALVFTAPIVGARSERVAAPVRSHLAVVALALLACAGTAFSPVPTKADPLGPLLAAAAASIVVGAVFLRPRPAIWGEARRARAPWWFRGVQAAAFLLGAASTWATCMAFATAILVPWEDRSLWNDLSQRVSVSLLGTVGGVLGGFLGLTVATWFAGPPRPSAGNVPSSTR